MQERSATPTSLSRAQAVVRPMCDQAKLTKWYCLAAKGSCPASEALVNDARCHFQSLRRSPECAGLTQARRTLPWRLMECLVQHERWSPVRMRDTRCPLRIEHWHLRKCAGTAIRTAMKGYVAEGHTPRSRLPQQSSGSRYVEYHMNYRWMRLLSDKAAASDVYNGCGVRRIVVLREPYSQFISELAYFPFSFIPERAAGNISVAAITALLLKQQNRLVCHEDAHMGLCEPACNATRVLGMLLTFDFVGFTDAMDRVYQVLRGWVSCNSSAETEHTLEMEAARARYDALTGQVKESSDGGLARLTVRAIRRMDFARAAIGLPPSELERARWADVSLGRTKELSHWETVVSVLRAVPPRHVFERNNRCAMDVYRRARERFGVRGGPWPPHRHDCH